MIADHLKNLTCRIKNACERAERDVAEVTLVAVAKGQPASKIWEAVQTGVRQIGENYAQEMLSHAGAIHEWPLYPIEWHFIGHLQRNKVKPILEKVALIHSVDSLPLAEEINRRATALGKIQPILLELNLGGEGSKTGLAPTKLESVVRELVSMSALWCKGLMTVPPEQPTPEAVRPFFRQLREIRDAINDKKMYKSPLTELSMGMTRDFEVAIEEGATIVRIGTGIFGARGKNDGEKS